VFFVFCLDPPRNGTLCWPSLFHPFEEAILPQCQLFFTLNDKIPSFNFNFMNPCTTNSANSKHDPFPCKSHVRLFVVVQTCVLYSLVLPPTWPITFDLLQWVLCCAQPVSAAVPGHTKVSGDQQDLFVCFVFVSICSCWYLVCFDEAMCKLSYWDAEHSTFQMTFKVDLWEDANLQLIYGFCKLQIFNKRTLRNMDLAQ